MHLPAYLTLTGLKHAGKSSVARELSRAWPGTNHIDTDQIILERAARRGFPCPSPSSDSPESTPALILRQLFQELGHEAFAREEYLALQEVLEMPRQERLIIATGGGVCDNLEAMKLLEECRPIFYLRADPEVLFGRIAAGGIPPFLDPQDPRGSFLRLANRRDLLYREQADHLVDVSHLTVDEVAQAILKLHDRKGANTPGAAEQQY
ncbi:hypothetical protein AU468_13170 [Alkalispirochaeta sphaeroplastigenens]|uniref:Shikimate kinase n=1 Tax=Alkalispirochaeta sphaeroplastigenens TaxID=1187066 RepID=A0A2S4JGB0_9SPIO|nr:shikimate kinase [Alkalispirochaeta sphaeroplastigenens]POQ98529.1 hypothetical protein AU468_13170 [Alkalispirochaeta sphaeroplastigenens]